jgi:hypothetical protein
MITDKQNIYLRSAQLFTFNPEWPRVVAFMQSKEELFKEVAPHGFINPDALREVTEQGLYWDYQAWKNRNKAQQNGGDPTRKMIDKIVND